MSTCYAAGSMPLAFMQEYFLVFMQFSGKNWPNIRLAPPLWELSASSGHLGNYGYVTVVGSPVAEFPFPDFINYCGLSALKTKQKA